MRAKKSPFFNKKGKEKKSSRPLLLYLRLFMVFIPLLTAKKKSPPKPTVKQKKSINFLVTAEWRISGLHSLIHFWVLNLQTLCLIVLMEAKIPRKTRVLLFVLPWGRREVGWGERDRKVLYSYQEERPDNSWLHRITALIRWKKRRNTDSEQVTFKSWAPCISVADSALVDFHMAFCVDQILSLERSSLFWLFKLVSNSLTWKQLYS